MPKNSTTTAVSTRAKIGFTRVFCRKKEYPTNQKSPGGHFEGNRIHLITRMAVMGAVLITLFIFLARFDWRLELLSHFRLQFVVGLLLLALLLLLLRWWKSMALVALCLVPQLFALSSHYLPFGRDHRPPMGPELKVMAFNVLSKNREHQAVRELILATDPDILLLSEMNSRWRHELVALEDRYPYSTSRTREGNFGMLLFSKLPITEQKFILDAEIRTPLLLAKLAWGDREISLVGLHPLTPISREGARSRNATFARVADLARGQSPLIIAGDFNCSSYSPYFHQLKGDLRDSAQGRGNAMTWHQLTPLLGIPIDHILYDDSLVCTAREIGPKRGSDHSAVIATFRRARAGSQTTR